MCGNLPPRARSWCGMVVVFNHLIQVHRPGPCQATGPWAKTGYRHTGPSPQSLASVNRDNPKHTFYLLTGTNLPTTGRLPYHNRYRGHHSFLAQFLYSASVCTSRPLFLRLCKHRHNPRYSNNPTAQSFALFRSISGTQFAISILNASISNTLWYGATAAGTGCPL